MLSLANKTALVTGSSSGIGLAITQRLLSGGCRVIGIARDHGKAGIDDELFTPLTLDLARLERITQDVGELCKQQVIDYFIHCAGEGLFGSIEQFSLEQIDHNLRTNLTSALALAHYVVPAMRRRKSGRIIFIGSESAIQAGRKGALYSSAKFGLRGLAQSLRDDCSRDGIAVTLINPGMVRTPFFDELNFRPGADRTSHSNTARPCVPPGSLTLTR